jgi:hypothetical protein
LNASLNDEMAAVLAAARRQQTAADNVVAKLRRVSCRIVVAA